MTKSKSAAPASNKKKYDPSQNKPYNRYNIYYILERERFLQSNSNYKSKSAADVAAADASSSNFITGYENLDVPHLPAQYARLDLPLGWYMPGKRKATKRCHKKSHGLASFQEIARIVADGYRSIDDVTLEYVTTVATILKQRHAEMRGVGRLSALDSVSDPSNSDKTYDENTQYWPEQMRSVGRLTALDSVSNPSNSDKTYDESTQYWPEQTRHKWASTPKMSDSIVNSSAAVAATRCPSNTTLRDYYWNDYNDAREVSPNPRGGLGEYHWNAYGDAQEAMPIPSSTSEVDISDKDILAMWNAVS